MYVPLNAVPPRYRAGYLIMLGMSHYARRPWGYRYRYRCAERAFAGLTSLVLLPMCRSDDVIVGGGAKAS
jgi:hypothetical protein